MNGSHLTYGLSALRVVNHWLLALGGKEPRVIYTDAVGPRVLGPCRKNHPTNPNNTSKPTRS